MSQFMYIACIIYLLYRKHMYIWSEVKVTLSCPTLCDPMDCSPPGSSVHGIVQARMLEWVAISFPRGSSPPRDGSQVSCISCTDGRILHHCQRRRMLRQTWDFPDGTVDKNPPASAGVEGSTPGPGRSHMPRGRQAHVPLLWEIPHSRAQEPHYWAWVLRLWKPEHLAPVLHSPST